MPTDAERWRFLSHFKLTIYSANGEYSVQLWKSGGPGMPMGFYPIASGKSAEEAVDKAIARWERQHKKKWQLSSG